METIGVASTATKEEPSIDEAERARVLLALRQVLATLRARAPVPKRPSPRERARALLAAAARARLAPEYGDHPADRAEPAYWHRVLTRSGHPEHQVTRQADRYATAQGHELEVAALDGRPARLLTPTTWADLLASARATGRLT